MHRFYFSILPIALFACSGIRPPETYTPEDIDAVDRDDAFDVTQLGANFSRTGNTYQITLGGEVIGEISSNAEYAGHDQFALITQSTYRLQPIAINGQFVDGFAVSGFDTSSGLSEGAFGLQGTETSTITRDSANYNTVYFAANASDTNNPTFTTTLVLEIDFDTGAIYGESPASGGNPATIFTGQLYGNAALVNIQDLWGMHDAEAGFYGENGAEFAGGYFDGEVSGLFYGEVQ